VLDPTDYRHGNNFTTHFFERIADHLEPGGVVAIQATSPFDSPRTFANVEQTVRASGLTTLSYRANIPSLGVWGFVLASAGPLEPPTRPAGNLASFDQRTLEAMFYLPGDVTATSDRPSRLYDQLAVRLLSAERRASR
jgi:spermidine synthase